MANAFVANSQIEKQGNLNQLFMQADLLKDTAADFTILTIPANLRTNVIIQVSTVSGGVETPVITAIWTYTTADGLVKILAAAGNATYRARAIAL